MSFLSISEQTEKSNLEEDGIFDALKSGANAVKDFFGGKKKKKPTPKCNLPNGGLPGLPGLPGFGNPFNKKPTLPKIGPISMGDGKINQAPNFGGTGIFGLGNAKS